MYTLMHAWLYALAVVANAAELDLTEAQALVSLTSLFKRDLARAAAMVGAARHAARAGAAEPTAAAPDAAAEVSGTDAVTYEALLATRARARAAPAPTEKTAPIAPAPPPADAPPPAEAPKKKTSLWGKLLPAPKKKKHKHHSAPAAAVEIPAPAAAPPRTTRASPPAAPSPLDAPPVSHTPTANARDRARQRSPRFSWADAQAAFRRCANDTTPAVRPDRYAYWTSTSALGNSLNIWMHVFLYALASGRQPVVGGGAGPEHLCGTHGAFECGVPFRGPSWLKAQSKFNIDGDAERDEAVAVGSVHWYRYNGAQASPPGSGMEKGRRRLFNRCYGEALRCPARRLDKEACLMVRAMQLLLPGSRLRPEFVNAARVEAKRRWRGDLDEFETVVAPRPWAHEDQVFFDPPLVEDAGTRWAGGLHLRSQPPKLEGSKDPHFADYFQRLTNASATPQGEPKDFRRPTTKLWSCAAGSAIQNAEHAATLGLVAANAPTSLFLATDTSGLCVAARAALAQRSATLQIACMDAEPVHLTRQTAHEPVSEGSDDGLDGHQAVILDWYLLQRARWLAPVSRAGWQCHHGARREDNHAVDKPGASFYGWALAAAGLVAPGPHWPAARANCGCRVDGHKISVFAPPRGSSEPPGGK